jgi:ribosomal protein S18 acetylase RimI-like enzyme
MTALHKLETAAFLAWPARHVESYQGWTLRFDAGYTKRANSANSSEHACRLSATELAYIEGRYAAHRLPPVFRLTSLAPVDASDTLLDGHGYVRADASRVMTADLGMDAAAQAVAATDTIAWLEGYARITGQAAAARIAHLDILRRIEAPCHFALIEEAGQPVCCGLGVIAGDRLGLFDIATAPRQRGRGLARQLCRGLLAWGQRTGARSAFLQVTEANAAAIGLYGSLGFRDTYRYWYRVRPTTP